MGLLESTEQSSVNNHLNDLKAHKVSIGKKDHSITNTKKMLDSCQSMADVIIVRKDILAYKKRMLEQSKDVKNTKERREFYKRCADKADDALEVVKKFDFSIFKVQPNIESIIGLL